MRFSFRKFKKNTNEISDITLLTACANGNKSALGILYDRFNEIVYRFLGQFVGYESPDIDDLVQATFIEVYRSANQFSNRSQVKTWIMGIAANTARYHIRRESRRRNLTETYAEQLKPLSELPDDLASRRQELLRIKTAVSQLPEEQKIVFVMCDIENWRGVDVAQSLDIPNGTVWRRLHEARKAIRKALNKGSKR